MRIRDILADLIGVIAIFAIAYGALLIAHGSAQRVGRLRGYGNAIVAQVAQTFIESMMDEGLT